jgi:hypothetical protein
VRCGLQSTGPAARPDRQVADQIGAVATLHALEHKATLEQAKRSSGSIGEPGPDGADRDTRMPGYSRILCWCVHMSRNDCR